MLSETLTDRIFFSVTVAEKKKIVYQREQRQYYFMDRQLTPPPEEPVTLHDMYKLACYRAAQLMSNPNSDMWKRNGGARQYGQALKELPGVEKKKRWIRRHIREERQKRRELRVEVLRRNHRRRQQEEAKRMTSLTVDSAAAAAEWDPSTSSSTPVTSEAVEAREEPRGKRKMSVTESVRKRMRDSFYPRVKLNFEEDQPRKNMKAVRPPTPFPDEPSPQKEALSSRIEAMRPVLEAVDFRKIYSSRHGERTTTGPRTPEGTPPREEKEEEEEEIVVLEARITTPPPPYILSSQEYRRKIKQEEDEKMERTIYKKRNAALNIVEKMEEEMSTLLTCFTHRKEVERYQALKKMQRDLDALKNGLQDDLLATAI